MGASTETLYRLTIVRVGGVGEALTYSFMTVRASDRKAAAALGRERATKLAAERNAQRTTGAPESEDHQDYKVVRVHPAAIYRRPRLTSAAHRA